MEHQPPSAIAHGQSSNSTSKFQQLREKFGHLRQLAPTAARRRRDQLVSNRQQQHRMPLHPRVPGLVFWMELANLANHNPPLLATPRQ
jgi:hypothetical protein